MAEFKQAPEVATPARETASLDLPSLPVTLLAVAGIGILVALIWTTGERRPWHRGSRRDDAGDGPR